ncbi:MAG: hypothetical protein H7X93_08500 [Sphingomonadaceae bacterium]|nr:hypothetical protein [Sphingomonadaceae bacterium]
MVSPANHDLAVSNGRLSRHMSVGAPTPLENLGLALRTAFEPARGGDGAARELDRLLEQIR